MNLIGPDNQETLNEIVVIQKLLAFDQASILELGCGAADKTRLIAELAGVKNITAVEIDPIQHKKNIEVDIDKVTFKSYGAQKIEEPDSSFDAVMLFKSLHHVPIEAMDKALSEIHRVLKPGGKVYFSEPVFQGEFNEILRLFHDEEVVRKEAFSAIKRAVDADLLALEEEYFFKNRIKMQSFSQFENGIINATHTDIQITDEILEEVKRRFSKHETAEGFVFEFPNRIDLLRKAS